MLEYSRIMDMKHKLKCSQLYPTNEVVIVTRFRRQHLTVHRFALSVWCQLAGRCSWSLKLSNFGEHLGVSKNRGVSPQIINSNRVFPYKPSILGYPYFWKHRIFWLCVTWNSQNWNQLFRRRWAEERRECCWPVSCWWPCLPMLRRIIFPRAGIILTIDILRMRGWKYDSAETLCNRTRIPSTIFFLL